MQHPPLTLTAKARQRWIGYDRLVLADAGRQRIGVDKDAGFEQLRMFQCPVALGRQPSVAIRVPSFIIFSMNVPIVSISAGVGGLFVSFAM